MRHNGPPLDPAESDRPLLVPIKLLNPDVVVPRYAFPGDAGADLYSAEDTQIFAGQRQQVHTGIAIALPPGYVGLIHPRSGLAIVHGLTVLNAPGTIDSGYRGEILINLINHDPVRIARIQKGDRIAQLIVQRVERAAFKIVEQLPATRRGLSGHGSTGTGQQHLAI